MALFGHAASRLRCPLIGAKRTSHMDASARFFSRALGRPIRVTLIRMAYESHR